MSEAVALASELRAMAHGRVQIRPVSPRLLDRRWKVTLTIPGSPHAVRVLIVDDSAPFRQAARELLRRRGYLVVGEVGTAAAVDAAVEHLAPHALLVDVGLPDGCGFELAERLTRTQPDLAVLLTSANDQPAWEQRLNASGARGFVPKAALMATRLEQFWPAPSP